MRWRTAVRNALCIVGIGLVIGLIEGLSPQDELSSAVRAWATGNFAYTLAVAILFFAVATQSFKESLRQAFMTLGVYTLASILIGLALSAWVAAPPLVVLIEWLLVLLGALVGTAVGAWMRMVKTRQRAMSASGR